MVNDWIAVEERLPEDDLYIEMKDSEGRTSEGYRLNGMWRFFHWGSGDPIEYWRYLSVDNRQQ